jgi:uncharacterized protein YqeY
MTPTNYPDHAPIQATTAIRAALRADLTAAMKARDRDAVTALRTAIAAIDNAEAVEDDGLHNSRTGRHVAGAAPGVGSTEAARRDLTTRDVRAILRAQIADRIIEAATYDGHGQTQAADRLRREANALTRFIES